MENKQREIKNELMIATGEKEARIKFKKKNEIKRKWLEKWERSSEK